MTKDAGCGTLAISIDLTSAASDYSPEDEAELASVDTLLGMLRDSQMPATWATAKPARSKAVKEVLAEDAGHEIALRLCGLEAPGSDARRVRELKHELEQAERCTQKISTVLANTVPSVDLLQNVCRWGVAGVVTMQPAVLSASAWNWLSRFQFLVGRQDESAQPHLLRYGLWRLPAVNVLSSAAAARRTLAIAAACGDIMSLTVGRAQVSRAGGAKRLEQLLQMAFELRAQRQLSIVTATDLVARLRRQRASRPGKSILRPAA